MPKIAKELSAVEVRRITTAGMHAVGGVPGLHLHVTTSGARSWVLRLMVGNKRRDMGLGGFPGVSLADAREAARTAREAARDPIKPVDPVLERKRARSALLAEQAKLTTFAEACRLAIRNLSPGWSNAKHAQQWTNTLKTYAEPIIGAMLISDIGTAQVMKVLQQPADASNPKGPTLWEAKTETASRVRGRIETVLSWATTQGLRSGENPARWRGHLDNLLPKRSKVSAVEHHEAVPIDAMAEFFARLSTHQGTGARALEFLVLTAARTAEVRGATWSEIDLDAAMWTIPAQRMKGRREHRVALSRASVDLLKSRPRVERSDLVFPSDLDPQRKLSEMTLIAVMRRMGLGAVPHGFRSTFRDWAAERTNYPSELAEMALAHAIKDKTEAAYRRGDMLARRLTMMEDWARFCATPKGKPAAVFNLKERMAG